MNTNACDRRPTDRDRGRPYRDSPARAGRKPHPPRADMRANRREKEKKPTTNTNENTPDENSTPEEYTKTLRGRAATRPTTDNDEDE